MFLYWLELAQEKLVVVFLGDVRPWASSHAAGHVRACRRARALSDGFMALSE